MDFYAESFIVFLELLWQSIRGISWEDVYYGPSKVSQFYMEEIQQGFTVSNKIDACIGPKGF
jgi:hypothetical protein